MSWCHFSCVYHSTYAGSQPVHGLRALLNDLAMALQPRITTATQRIPPVCAADARGQPRPRIMQGTSHKHLNLRELPERNRKRADCSSSGPRKSTRLSEEKSFQSMWASFSTNRSHPLIQTKGARLMLADHTNPKSQAKSREKVNS